MSCDTPRGDLAGREQSPGMMARSGKCPVKKLSFMVTFLYPTADF